MVISYKECLKNHAATSGGHALDGCGEFMASRAAVLSDPTSLKCAACGCHRNFHRRELDDLCRPSSPFPLPISHIAPAFHAPPMLLTLSSGFGGASPEEFTAKKETQKETEKEQKKRKRTKFSREQKEKMRLFAEKMGWRMRKSEEKLVQEFCNEIGIGKRVLKVWMHNNKYIAGKVDRGRNSQCSSNGGND